MSSSLSPATDFDVPADALPQQIWKAQPGGPVEKVNRQMCEYFGYSPEKLRSISWNQLIHPDDVSRMRACWHRCLETADETAVEIRLQNADGTYNWHRGQIIPRRDENGQVVEWIGVYTSLENRPSSQKFGSPHGTSRALPAGVDDSLQETLNTLVHLIEKQCPEILASVLLTDEEGRRLYHGAAPSLPNAYNRSIDGIQIGPNAGSCGTAAHEGQPVICENIYEDPRWEEFRELAAEHGLAACWSIPIILSNGEIAGTFAMYYRKPRKPNPRERGLAEIATYLAQLAIERSRAEFRLRELVGDLDAIVWEADVSSWAFTYVSPRAEEILGYPPDEWLGDPDFWARTIHPDDREAAIRYCEQCTRQGRSHEFEYRALTDGGETVWLRDIVNVVTDKAGEPQKLRGVMVDVTERKQIEQELQQSEERFRATFEQAAVGIAHVAPDGRWLRFNQTFAEMVGYPKEELSDLTYQDLTHPEDLEPSNRWVRRLLEGEIETASYEKRYVRKNGSVVWVHLTTTLKRDAAGRPEYFISVFEDITEKKKAEQRFQALTEALPDIVWTARKDGSFTYVNERWSSYTGTDPAEALQDGWQSFLHPRDKERTLRAWEAALTQEESFEIEHRLQASDGYRWFITRGLPLRDSEGQVEQWLGTTTDIHEKTELEEELRAQTETLETINEAGRTLAAELELKQLVQAVTDAGTDITGAEIGGFFCNEAGEDGESYTLYTLTGAPEESFEDFTRPRKADLFGPTLGGKEVIRLDDMTRDPRFGKHTPSDDLSEVHLPIRSYLAVPVVSSSDEVVGGLFFGHRKPGIFTARDENIITGIAAQAAVAIDNARLYRTARKNEERFRAVTENAVDIIATIDRDTKLQYVSPSVEDVLGYSPEELIEQPLTDYIHPDDRHEARNEFVALTLVPEDVGSFTLRFTHAEGSTRHLAVKARNMENRPGVEGLLLNIRDITDLKRYEQELIDAKETAEEMTRVKSNLLANMSHEIRTPLTGILGLAEGLAPKVSGEEREEVRLIEKSGRRLMDTLDSVMALAQLEGEELEISRESVNVTEEVQEVAGALDHLAAEKELFLEVRSEASEVKARVDRTLLGRILNNLISNAIKFTKEGGVTVTVSATDPEVAISVADTGVGISEEFKPHLFEEFTQESTGLARSHEGIGLGLVLTKKMTDLLGGSISVSSDKGEGSTFTVTLPRAGSTTDGQEKTRDENAEDDPADLRSEEPPGESTTSVLLVEDNDVIRRVIVERLGERNGYEIEAFAEAEPALERAEEKTVDVVLIDISLPTMDGVEALRKLRSTETYRHRPIIAVTGHALPGDRERFLEEGFSGYMAKPFSAQELAQKIRTLSAK